MNLKIQKVSSKILYKMIVYLPSIFAIALRGLRALKVLIVLKIEILPAPSKLAPKFTNDTATITKSSQHQALLK